MPSRILALSTAAVAAASLLAAAHAEEPYPSQRDDYPPQSSARLEQRRQYQPAPLYPNAYVWPEVGPWAVGYPKDYPESVQPQQSYASADASGTSAYGGGTSAYGSSMSANAQYQQSPPAGSGRARIGVFVPDGARVWVNGDEPSAASAPRLRDYVTPALIPGADYHYEVRACWQKNGRTVDETRTVAIHANGWASVDFTRPERGR